MSTPTVVAAARGRKGIEAIRARMGKLVQFYQDYRPGSHLVLPKPDYDLIRRWPRAAHECGFDVTDNGVFFGGIECSYNTEAGRYEPKQKSEQAVIE